MSRSAVTASRIPRLLLSLLLASGTAVGVSLAAQEAASAAVGAAVVQPMSSTGDCPVNDLCWWVGTNQTGKMHPVRDAIYDWHTQSEPSCGGDTTWNDCASTLYNNRSGFGAQVYANSYPKGGSPSVSDPGYCLEPGSRVALDLTQVHYSNEVSLTVDNSISSNRWRTGGC